jgi:hypothetical protein
MALFPGKKKRSLALVKQVCLREWLRWVLSFILCRVLFSIAAEDRQSSVLDWNPKRIRTSLR